MKKSLMLKLLTILAILSINLSANSDDEKVVNFIKKAVSASKNYTLENITILKKEPIKDVEGFYAYFFKIDLMLKTQKKLVSINDIIFTNGVVISKDFQLLKTNQSLKNSMTLDVDESFYDKKHLIEGKIEAKNKLVLFSDPLCPFCMDFVPEVIEFVRKNPNDFALFYYSFPLSMHPGAKTLVKATLAAKEKGVENILFRVYEEAFDLEKSDEKSVLDEFNKAFKTDITIDDISKAKFENKLENDIKKANSILIKGTPTLFVNGKRDVSKKAYKKMGK